MDRRGFLKRTGLTLTALVAATSALEALPAAAATPSLAAPTEPVRDLVAAPRLTVTRLNVRAPGEYRVSGLVRLEAPTVEISGIASARQISWSGALAQPSMLVSFSSVEQYDGLGPAPELTVRGGRLESLSVVPVLPE